MVMVGVDNGSREVGSQPQSVGLVWGLVVVWRCICMNELNLVNSCNCYVVLMAPQTLSWLLLLFF